MIPNDPLPESCTSPSTGVALAQAIDRAFAVAEQTRQALETVAELRRDLILEDPDSEWHQIFDMAVARMILGITRASLLRPFGTGAVARAMGVSTATVSAACASGAIPTSRSDAGAYQIEPEDGRNWMVDQE